jgi:hypothetical protein
VLAENVADCDELTGDETGEERLGAQVFVVLLEVRLGGRHHLEGNELVTSSISRSIHLAGKLSTLSSRSGS